MLVTWAAMAKLSSLSFSFEATLGKKEFRHFPHYAVLRLFIEQLLLCTVIDIRLNLRNKFTGVFKVAK